MAIAVASDKYVRPLEGALIRRVTVGTGGAVAGEIACMGTDGAVLVDGSTGNNRAPIGVFIETGAVASKVDLVTYGAIACVTGGAEGSEVYPADGSPGIPSLTSSTKKYSIGYMESATVIFVRPIYIA